MKRLLTILIVMSTVTLGGAKCVSKPASGTNNQPSRTITHLTYCLRASMRQPLVYYELIVNDSVLTLKNACGRNEEDAISKQVDACILDSLQQIIDEEKVMNYKRSYTPSTQICDGHSWYLEIMYSDESYLLSSGQNAGPRDKGRERITELFRQQFANE